VIGQLHVIRRVKKIREEKALAALSAARDGVAAAEQVVARSEAALAESAGTLRAREDAVFAPILATPVSRERIDEAKEDVQALHEGHQRLADRLARARHALEERRRALEEARLAHAAAQRAVDKVDHLIETLSGEAERAAEAAEELEIEDAFGRPKGEAAGASAP
jgi:flagellar biosynthesis chaperone FliJ